MSRLVDGRLTDTVGMLRGTPSSLQRCSRHLNGFSQRFRRFASDVLFFEDTFEADYIKLGQFCFALVKAGFSRCCHLLLQ